MNFNEINHINDSFGLMNLVRRLSAIANSNEMRPTKLSNGGEAFLFDFKLTENTLQLNVNKEDGNGIINLKASLNTEQDDLYIDSLTYLNCEGVIYQGEILNVIDELNVSLLRRAD